jgi:hypothetical protein
LPVDENEHASPVGDGGDIPSPVDEGGVIPSPVDPEYECVPVRAIDSAPTPPPGGEKEPYGTRLCPDGYVPRRRRRVYDLDGKVIRTGRPPERNPDAG